MTRIRKTLAAALAALALVACEKNPFRPSGPPSANGQQPVTGAEFLNAVEKRYPNDPAKKARAVATVEEDDAIERQSVIDQKEMVIPAPGAFQPGTKVREIRLQLSVEKSLYRAGETPRIRVILQNTGRDPLRIWELSDNDHSFFKSPKAFNQMGIQFHLVLPDGHDEVLAPSWGGNDIMTNEIVPPSSLSENGKKKWIHDSILRASAESKLKITLAPGESVATRDGKSRAPYADIGTNMAVFFEHPGTYRIYAVLDDRPIPLSPESLAKGKKFGIDPKSEEQRYRESLERALGPRRSNDASFELAPNR